MHKMTITGRLEFDNLDATPNEKNQFYFAFTDNRTLNAAINPETEYLRDGIVFKSSPFVTMECKGMVAAAEFIDALKEVMQKEEAKVLDIYGNFDIRIDSGYLPYGFLPSSFKIEVKGGQVFFQQALYSWTDPILA